MVFTTKCSGISEEAWLYWIFPISESLNKLFFPLAVIMSCAHPKIFPWVSLESRTRCNISYNIFYQILPAIPTHRTLYERTLASPPSLTSSPTCPREVTEHGLGQHLHQPSWQSPPSCVSSPRPCVPHRPRDKCKTTFAPLSSNDQQGVNWFWLHFLLNSCRLF